MPEHERAFSEFQAILAGIDRLNRLTILLQKEIERQRSLRSVVSGPDGQAFAGAVAA